MSEEDIDKIYYNGALKRGELAEPPNKIVRVVNNKPAKEAK